MECFMANSERAVWLDKRQSVWLSREWSVQWQECAGNTSRPCGLIAIRRNQGRKVGSPERWCSQISRLDCICGSIMHWTIHKSHRFVCSFVAGGAARCAGHRLRVLGDGHGGRRRGGVEWGAVLREEELQGTRGEDSAGVRKPDPAGTSEHRQVPSLLDGHTQRQAAGETRRVTLTRGAHCLKVQNRDSQ